MISKPGRPPGVPVASWYGALPQRGLCQPLRSGARRYRWGVRLVWQTAIGNPRWRCSVCGKTFSYNAKATARQREHHKNKTCNSALEIALVVLYLAVFLSVLSYAIWSIGEQAIRPTAAGIYMNLVAVFGILMAILILSERPQPYHAAGFVLIVAGVWLASQRGPLPGLEETPRSLSDLS